MVSDSEIMEYIEQAADPFLTTREIADEFDYSPKGIRKRLKPLHEDGQLGRKRAGTSDIWWDPDRID